MIKWCVYVPICLLTVAAPILPAVSIKYVTLTSQVVKPNASWGSYKVNSNADAVFPNLGLSFETGEKGDNTHWAYTVHYSKDVLDEDCFSFSTGPIFRLPITDQWFLSVEPAIAITKASYFEYASNGSVSPAHVRKNELDLGINLGAGVGYRFSDRVSVRFQYDWVGIRPHRLGSDFADVVNSTNGNHRVWTGAWQGYTLGVTADI